MPRLQPCAHGVAGLLALALSGCSSDAPKLDAQWGQSLSQAQTRQTAYPMRSQTVRGPIETDAVVSGLGIKRYHHSFENPPQPQTVLQMGVGPGAMKP